MADARNHRIQRFTRDGKFLGKFGVLGNGPGQFNMPWGVAVNATGEIYVTDWRNDRVQKFTQEGDYLLEWGTSGSGAGPVQPPRRHCR